MAEGVFDQAMIQRATEAVRQLSPPATDVVLCHLDAPGWVLVDLRPHRELSSGILQGLFSSPSTQEPSSKRTVISRATSYKDAGMALSATLGETGLFWEWEPAPRYAIYGFFPVDQGWTGLQALILRTGAALRAALPYEK